MKLLNDRSKFRVCVRTFVVLLCIQLGVILGCHGAEKTKVAEGEYGVTESPSKQALGKTIDQWTLWRLPDGRLQVEVILPSWALGRLQQAGRSLVQSFTFAKNMELIGYEVHAIAKEGQINLSCELRPRLIRCRDPNAGRAEARVENVPYTFMPADFYALDWAWFYASVIHDEIRPTFQTPVYWLELPDEDSKMKIIPQGSQPVKFLGNERISILGKQVNSNKYQFGDQQLIIWTATNSSIVLAAQIAEPEAASTMTGGSVGKIELVKFMSYDKEFMPELSK